MNMLGDGHLGDGFLGGNPDATYADIDLLWVMAWDLLDTATAILDEEALQAPRRRGVDVGAKPLPPLALPEEESGEERCQDQLNVVINGPFPAAPNQLITLMPTSAPGQQGFTWAADIRLTLWREHSVAFVEQPSPAQLDASARDYLRDVWQLARGLAWRATHWHDYPIFPRIPAANMSTLSLQFQPFVTEGPMGGLRGATIPMRVLVTDLYEPPT